VGRFVIVTDVIVPSGATFFLGRQGQQEAAGILAHRMRDALAGAERFAKVSRFIAGAAFSIAHIAGFTITGTRRRACLGPICRTSSAGSRMWRPDRAFS
jgi:hypothetical protein